MNTLLHPRFTIRSILLVACAAFCMAQAAQAQSRVQDSIRHPFRVNGWLSGGIILAGGVAVGAGISSITNKPIITPAELSALDRSDFSAMDRRALELDASRMNSYRTMSNYVLAGIIAMPALTLFDDDIRRDWTDMVLMFLETELLAYGIYLYSPLGPAYIDRFRPRVYYEESVTFEERTRSTNRNSFYSGHVAAAAAATFFSASMINAYNPELGWTRYLVYSAAAVPPLVLSYFRLRGLSHFPSDLLVGLGVGALCGILVPELHRLFADNTALGLYSSPEGTGIRIAWKPEF